ncbi:unnamed protein product [Scytosiphon promiscuus]
MAAITAACTCSVDGHSGDANTRYKGYSFTGCGAHVDYKLSLLSGAGYERVWCYVTSPRDCPGNSPYIPEGFKIENTLPEWLDDGAAWKECYDGYRCEAWWGDLEASPVGEPVVLDAPLDWPDCCALCSKSNGDDTTVTTAVACEAWSFDPSTGSCQLMSAVQSTSVDYSWEVSGMVHGYPGFFEAPLNDCWIRSTYDLCENSNLFFVIFGVILAFFGLLCVYCSAFRAPWKRTSLLRELLADPESSRLVKAACVKVTCNRFALRSRKGVMQYSDCYEGTFVTRDGALFVVPPATRRRNPKLPAPGRSIENFMLRVLYDSDLDPQGSTGRVRNPMLCFASRHETQTTQDRKELYHKFASSWSRPPGTRSAPGGPGTSQHRFECLLLSTAGTHSEATTRVMLVGVLGEDRISCIDEDLGISAERRAAPAGSDSKRGKCGFFCLFVGAASLIIMCISLLTNRAAQKMATWTFEGDSRVGATVGLALCTLIPGTLFLWERLRDRQLKRLIEEFPPATA